MPPFSFNATQDFRQTPFSSNPLVTRTDVQNFLKALLDPLAAHTSPGGGSIHLGYTGTHFDERAALLEGYARPLWGLSSLLAGGGDYDGMHRWTEGLKNGTDPTQEGGEFWGWMRDKDQRMVECSPIGFSLAVAPMMMWDGLNDAEKQRVGEWLNAMNSKEMPNTNWLWFRVFANLGLSKVGSPFFNPERMKADMDHLDTFYIGDGWSRDGPEGVVQLDYYSSSFAIQVAQLVYSKLAQEQDPDRCEEYRERARKFAFDFVCYFDEEGRAIPFGRSMTYRCAMSAFWAALAFADVSLPAPLTWGVVRGILLRNLRYWANQPGAYYPDGTFTIGYCYPNLNLTENYNSPGSTYWACKAFVCLAVPESHPFWSSEEEPYPAELKERVKVLEKPFHIASNLGGHTIVLSSGQQCSYPVKQTAAKYGKFAYSSAFGYSVPTGDLTLEEESADNMIAVSNDDGETWKCRIKTQDARFETDEGSGTTWLRSMWYPWPGVEIETWLVPPQKNSPNWHVRVHRIKNTTKQSILTGEGGFAIHGQGIDGRALEALQDGGSPFGNVEKAGEALSVSPAGASAVIDIPVQSANVAKRDGKAIRTDPNSNLIVPRAVLPTLRYEQSASTSQELWYATGVFAVPTREGEDGPPQRWQEEWKNRRPTVPEALLKLISG